MVDVIVNRDKALTIKLKNLPAIETLNGGKIKAKMRVVADTAVLLYPPDWKSYQLVSKFK